MPAPSGGGRASIVDARSLWPAWLCAQLLAVSLACGSASNEELTDAATAAACSCGEGDVCSGGECVPLTCTDLKLTGNETDVDCGGDCLPCSEGQACLGTRDCGSQFCSDNICRDCTGDDDCQESPDTYCSSGTCVSRQALGATCSADSECTSGYCVDGVCCDGPCDGSCEACGAGGACAYLAAGEPSDGDCVADADGSCGLDGTCDGAGGCRLRVADTACDLATCGGGSAGQGICDGVGICDPNGNESCDPYVCDVDDTCKSSCTSDADCVSGYYCDGQNECVKKASNGTGCGANKQCTSGFCRDNVCCNSSCNGTCESCAGTGTPSAAGVCDKYDAGTASASDCPTSAGDVCGNTGTCNGNGACNKASSNVECDAQTCSNGTETSARYCNGSGTCSAGSDTSCSPYACNGDSCRASCTTDSHCQSGYYCDGGTCTLKEAQGTSCGGANECASGNCVDGYCCNNACNGTCESCDGADTGGANGTCSDITSGDPDMECTAQSASTCGQTGQCAAGNKCELYAVGTECAAAGCSGSGTTWSSARTCDGAGTCRSPATTDTCSPYTCTSGGCSSSCSSDNDCASGYACSGGRLTGNPGDGANPGTCLLVANDGDPCFDDAMCPGDWCSADGNCCKASCAGALTCDSNGDCTQEF